MSLLTKLFNFVLLTSAKYNIDESHGLSHSMDVVHNAHKIYENEVPLNPYLLQQENIILTSAALHDMCDKKYMNEYEGIKLIEDFLKDKLDNEEIEITKKIITTMSYSTVKKNGFPSLGMYQHAYHIVREADLLSAYDFDRCMIYKMNTHNYSIQDAFTDAINLFKNRVYKHNDDNLFITEYSKELSVILEKKSHERINNWKKILL